MHKECKNCKNGFEITNDDLKFLEKTSPVFNNKKHLIPPPTLCHECRQQRRLIFRNERKLYQRKCDLCRAPIISIYSPDKAFKVYCSDCWWSDKWNPLEYGRDFDFNRPFFEQFADLMKRVPLLANSVFNSINCEYNGYCSFSKDSYMSVRVGDSENILYSYLSLHSLGCTDCHTVTKCQYCYECVDCWNCYNAYYCEQCKTTSDSSFCFDCIGCNHCFGCIGLRNCEYYFFNKKCTKEEYDEYVKKYDLGSYKNIKPLNEKFRKELSKRPRKAALIINSQNASGDYIVESKDIVNCFDTEKSDTVKNSCGVEYSRDVYDSNFIYYGENSYENMSNSHSANIFFTAIAIDSVFDVWYSMLCVSGTHDCFGCVALKRQDHCILNKKYSKKDFELLIPRIIEYMKKTGEFGEFFPVKIAPFAYNETVSNEYYPMDKKDVLAKEWIWKEDDKKQFEAQKFDIPDDIKNVTDDILAQTLKCDECTKNYKIVPQELKFYRQAGLAIPRKCPDCRHKNRVLLRNPRKLYDRKCMKCGADINTTYSPDRPEIVYCEACYLKEVY